MLNERIPAGGGKAAANSLKPFGFDFLALNRLDEHGLIILDYDSGYDMADHQIFRFRRQWCALFPMGSQKTGKRNLRIS